MMQSEDERRIWTEKIGAAIQAAESGIDHLVAPEHDPSTHSPHSDGRGKRRESVVLEARGQPASNIYRYLFGGRQRLAFPCR